MLLSQVPDDHHLQVVELICLLEPVIVTLEEVSSFLSCTLPELPIGERAPCPVRWGSGLASTIKVRHTCMIRHIPWRLLPCRLCRGCTCSLMRPFVVSCGLECRVGDQVESSSSASGPQHFGAAWLAVDLL